MHWAASCRRHVHAAELAAMGGLARWCRAAGWTAAPLLCPTEPSRHPLPPPAVTPWSACSSRTPVSGCGATAGGGGASASSVRQPVPFPYRMRCLRAPACSCPRAVHLTPARPLCLPLAQSSERPDPATRRYDAARSSPPPPARRRSPTPLLPQRQPLDSGGAAARWQRWRRGRLRGAAAYLSPDVGPTRPRCLVPYRILSTVGAPPLCVLSPAGEPSQPPVCNRNFMCPLPFIAVAHS